MGRREFGRDIGSACVVLLLILLLGGLLLLLLTLLGLQQALEGLFELAEGIGSCCDMWSVDATDAPSELEGETYGRLA